MVGTSLEAGVGVAKARMTSRAARNGAGMNVEVRASAVSTEPFGRIGVENRAGNAQFHCSGKGVARMGVARAHIRPYPPALGAKD